jgi:hypothetical protein
MYESPYRPIDNLINSIANGTFTKDNISFSFVYLGDFDANSLCAALKNNKTVASRIKTLNLSRTGITTIDIPNTLTSLESLVLCHNQFRHLSIPKGLVKLNCLNLIDNPDLESLDLPDTLNLQKLDFHYTRIKSINLPITLNKLILRTDGEYYFSPISALSLRAFEAKFGNEFRAFCLFPGNEILIERITKKIVQDHYALFFSQKQIIQRKESHDYNLQVTKDIITAHLLTDYHLPTYDGDYRIAVRISEYLAPDLASTIAHHSLSIIFSWLPNMDNHIYLMRTIHDVEKEVMGKTRKSKRRPDVIKKTTAYKNLILLNQYIAKNKINIQDSDNYQANLNDLQHNPNEEIKAILASRHYNF